MKFQNLISGIFLIVFGTLLLLQNFDLISFGLWKYVVNLWPLILVLVGINLLTKNGKKNPTSKEHNSGSNEESLQ
ncbi:MAG: hypothetical protein H6679_05695 [Epsilonproteobacteria bacterium]|nr:hypothetical protein [Campylobacterota bacterium]